MIWAKVEQFDKSENREVIIFVDERVANRKVYESFALAAGVLQHMGFAEFAGQWLPIVFNSTYAATIPTSRASGPMSRLSITENGTNLYLEVASAPFGYGFRFSLGDWNFPDPVVAILTTDLITVQLIGTWPSVDEARDAGLAFFKKVQELVGADLLMHLIDLVKEQWECQTQERRKVMGLTGTEPEPKAMLQSLKQSSRSTSSSS